VDNPLDTDWSAYKIPCWDQEAVNAKIRRRVARSRMRRFRSVPVARRIWWVTLTATEVSLDQFGPKDLPASLAFDSQTFWCLSRRRARQLVTSDQAAGGAGSMYPVEYRHCPVCGRMLIGPAAHDYRQKQMRPMSSWQFDDGPACSMDCKPNGRGPDGQHVAYKRKEQAA
jgi:ABC-type bacteriocin/lantibiotic exporter with double-glycine peptidase domain